MKIFLKLALMLAVSITLLNAKEIDKESGLIVDKGLQTVKTNCTVCHSAKFIILQKGDRETWKSMIRWMQKTQGLWEFTPEIEDEILTYL
jgi:cytochrome c5